MTSILDSVIPVLNTVLGISLSILVDLALILLGLLFVRPRNRTAGFLLAGSGCLFLLHSIVSPLSYTLMAQIGFNESYRLNIAFLGIAHALFRTLCWSILLWGIYRAAKPGSA